ncbi:hypothetical protein ACTWQL_21935 [Pseudalkalibacillus sp. R45]|uniref:hypothetical protein n=1 Tax=Pseudalkalibacillus sp. R45 TaxID=3457433 RepID=UPI003FCE66A3
MLQKLFCFLAVLAICLTNGCSTEGETIKVSSGSIDADEVLTLNPNADIFQYDGVIYKTNIEWVEELTLTKNEQVG